MIDRIWILLGCLKDLSSHLITMAMTTHHHVLQLIWNIRNMFLLGKNIALLLLKTYRNSIYNICLDPIKNVCIVTFVLFWRPRMSKLMKERLDSLPLKTWCNVLAKMSEKNTKGLSSALSSHQALQSRWYHQEWVRWLIGVFGGLEGHVNIQLLLLVLMGGRDA